MFFAEPGALPEAVRYAAVAGVVREPGTPERPPAAPPLPAERVTVALAGDDARAGELTWGQRMVWLSMLRWGWLNIGAPMPQPPGRTVADLADELRYMMPRFPSLRTRLRFDAEGRPSQELFADGEIAFEVYDADGDADPQKTAQAVYEAYLATARDFVREWPLPSLRSPVLGRMSPHRNGAPRHRSRSWAVRGPRFVAPRTEAATRPGAASGEVSGGLVAAAWSIPRLSWVTVATRPSR